jgi:hypothetical protein
MRHYRCDSPESAARIVAACLLSDGHLGIDELKALDRCGRPATDRARADMRLRYAMQVWSYSCCREPTHPHRNWRVAHLLGVAGRYQFQLRVPDR